MSNSALVVLSGGQDSTTCLLWAKRRFDQVLAISFDYGQRHQREIGSARMVADICGAALEVVKVGPILAGRSPLVNPGQDLERYQDFQQMDKTIGDRVELTFVPMRNALFLTLAANRAAVAGITNLVTGVCEADNANYPDCREVFVCQMQRMINAALGDEKFIIHTPLIRVSKAESVRNVYDMGMQAFATLAFTHTSYAGEYPPMDMNHANVLRAEGFRVARLPDPLIVRAYSEQEMDLPRRSDGSIHENYHDTALIRELIRKIDETRLMFHL